MVTQHAEQRSTGGMIRNETQADTGDLAAINNLPRVSERNADLELSQFQGYQREQIRSI